MLITTTSPQTWAPAIQSDDELFRLDVLGSTTYLATRPVILDDGHFRIVPTLGPLHRNHLLICSKREQTGIHQMSGLELRRLQMMIEGVKRVFTRLYGNKFVMFENGTRSGGESGCSIRHFHLHAVPTSRPSNLVASERGFQLVEDLAAAQKLAQLMGDYQLVTVPGNGFAIRRRGQLPSQYLRRRVAELNGIPEWDWRQLDRRPDWSECTVALSSLRAALILDISNHALH